MERSLLWSALAMGCGGWLCSLLLIYAQRMFINTPANAAGQANGLPQALVEPVEVAQPFLFTAAVVPLLVFLATLPTRAPFSSGQGWGRGFLLGGLMALLAGGTVLYAQRMSRQHTNAIVNSAVVNTAVITGPFFLAVVATGAPFLWLPPTMILIDPLVGIATGWFVVSCTLVIGLFASTKDQSFQTYNTTSKRYTVLALAAGIGFIVTLCTVAALGIYRDPLTTGVRNGTWSAIALTFGVSVPCTLICCSLFMHLALSKVRCVPLTHLFAGAQGQTLVQEEARTLSMLGWQTILCFVLLAGLASLLSSKAIDEPRLFLVSLVGLLLGLFAWWLVRNEANNEAAELRARQTHSDANPGVDVDIDAISPLAALVVLSAFMVSYQLLQGFGVGIMLLGAWLAVGAALPAAVAARGVTVRQIDEESEVKSAQSGPAYASQISAVVLPPTTTAQGLIRLLLFGVILLLYRFFSMRFRSDLQGVTLTDHYALFGFLVGATLPTLLVNLLSHSPHTSDHTLTRARSSQVQIGKLILAGALTLAVPGIIVVLWGAKCALALLAGLALATITGRWSGIRLPSTGMNSALLALAVALVLVQWTHRVLPLADMKRTERIQLLAYTVGALLVLLIIVDYGQRVVHWMRHRREGESVVISEGLME